MVVLLSFMAHPKVGFAKRVAPSLDSLFKRLPKELGVWAPVLVQMYRLKKSDQPRSDVLRFFERKSKYESNLFELSTTAFESFVKTTKTPARRLKVLLDSINDSMLIDHSEMLIKDIRSTFDKLAEIHCIKLECSANNLKEIVSNITIGNDYRRSNHFDYKFRPILISPERHTEKTVLSTDEAVWKTDASMITLDSIIKGKLMISKNSVSFKGAGKSVQIPIDSIKYVFNGPTTNSIQIFTTSYKLRVFDLGMIKASYFVINMPETFRPSFAQRKSSSEEIENMGLLKKWSSGKFSTFDFVMWFQKEFFISNYLSKIKPFSKFAKEPITSLQNLSQYLPPEYFFEPKAFEGIELDCAPEVQIRKNLEALENFDIIPWINKEFKEKLITTTERKAFVRDISEITKFEKIRKSYPGKINCAFFESSQHSSPTVISDGILHKDTEIRLANSEATFVESKTTVAFASKDSPSLKLVECKNASLYEDESGSETIPYLVDVSNHYVLAVKDDDVLSLFSARQGNKLVQEKSFSHHDADITAISISSTIGIAISGTDDGQLITYSIPKLHPLRAMCFDGVITKIRISPCSCLILVDLPLPQLLLIIKLLLLEILQTESIGYDVRILRTKTVPSFFSQENCMF